MLFGAAGSRCYGAIATIVRFSQQKEQKCERTLLKRKQRLVLILLNEPASVSLNKKNKNGSKSRGIALPRFVLVAITINFSIFVSLSLFEVLLLLS